MRSKSRLLRKSQVDLAGVKSGKKYENGGTIFINKMYNDIDRLLNK